MFALDLAGQTVGQIAFEMSTYLCLIFSIFDCDKQQETRLLNILSAEAPPARHGHRVVKNILAVRGVDGNDRELNLLLPIEIGQRCFQLLFGPRVDYIGVVIDVASRRW